MSNNRLLRMRRMSFNEIRWRAVESARTLGDRIHMRIHTPVWAADDISRALASPSSDAARRAASRPSRCVIDPRSADAVRTAVLRRWPDAAADARARADRILDGSYDLLGYRRLRFPDWHSDPVHQRSAPRVCWADVPYLDPLVGDHKIIWEFNRHQHWLQLGRAYWLTGDARYAQAIVNQMADWLDANPPLTGINWASMLEIGFRTISWTMAFHLLAAGARQPATAGSHLPAGRFFTALDRQLTHVEHHLSYYFSPNTHLTGEALALYVVGHAFPELAHSERWISTGRRVLLEEIERQILPDGGHAERSTHYQRYTLDFYLLALLTARRTADVDAGRTFASAVTRLAEFTRAMADDDGRLPLIGDDDGGMLWPIKGRECNDVRDSLAVAAIALDRPDLAPWGIPEEAFWIAGPEACHARSGPPMVDPLRSRTFPDTGYVVMRDSTDGHAVFDAGAHGYLNGGHAHADALSLTLGFRKPFLVDPGTSTYTINTRLRDRMRSSFNHNTLTVDGLPQSSPAGPFHWRTKTDGRLQSSRHNPGFDWVEALHDGYAPIEHRRSVVRARGAGWVVVDEVLGTGTHAAATHWQFHPGWMVQTDESGGLKATHLQGDTAWLLTDAGHISLFHGDDESGLGWYAPVYGTLLPTWTARVERTSDLPLSTIAWIGTTNATDIPLLERLTATADPDGRAIAARLTLGEFASTFLVRPGEPPMREGRASGLRDYQTDARFLHVRTRGDRLVALDIADASHALALHDGWVSVLASEPVPDLHLKLDGAVLELAASEPPRQLRLEGSGLTVLREVRLNGRVCPPSPTERPDTLLISGGEWARPALVHFGAQFALDEVRPDGCEEISPLRESAW